MIGILARTADYAVQPFAPEDLSAWPGKVLLVFGEEDPATPPEVQERLTALYPGCQVHVFERSWSHNLSDASRRILGRY